MHAATAGCFTAKKLLSFFRSYSLNFGREQCMFSRINRLVFDFDTRRILAKEVTVVPVSRRPVRPGRKATPAIWTDIAQNGINTTGAERALIAAYACFKRIRRQWLVAVLAAGSEFEHHFSVSLAAIAAT